MQRVFQEAHGRADHARERSGQTDGEEKNPSRGGNRKPIHTGIRVFVRFRGAIRPQGIAESLNCQSRNVLTLEGIERLPETNVVSGGSENDSMPNRARSRLQ